MVLTVQCHISSKGLGFAEGGSLSSNGGSDAINAGHTRTKRRACHEAGARRAKRRRLGSKERITSTDNMDSELNKVVSRRCLELPRSRVASQRDSPRGAVEYAGNSNPTREWVESPPMLPSSAARMRATHTIALSDGGADVKAIAQERQPSSPILEKENVPGKTRGNRRAPNIRGRNTQRVQKSNDAPGKKRARTRGITLEMACSKEELSIRNQQQKVGYPEQAHVNATAACGVSISAQTSRDQGGHPDQYTEIEVQVAYSLLELRYRP